MTFPETHVRFLSSPVSDGAVATRPVLIPKPWPIRDSPTGAHDGQLLSLSALSHRRSSTPNGVQKVGGLRMSQGFYHRPVLEREIIDLFSSVPAGIIVDATLGGGGHAEAMLQAFPNQHLIGIDRDIEAIEHARLRLATFSARTTFVHARNDDIEVLVRDAQHNAWPDTALGVSAVLFDLGVSSHQLDVGDRGFSYRLPGSLDMRMDQSSSLRADDLVNHAEPGTLETLFRENGETRFAGRIARAIVEKRPIASTVELAEVVASAVPIPARRKGHPARRVFQALRIAVNDELEILEPALQQSIDLLIPAGRLVVLAYHSGEDRIVKQTFLEASSGGCKCPPALPCVCGARPTVKLLTRGSKGASKEEVAANPRAKSARLRAIERLDPDAMPARTK